jgi:hypothetical protein
MDKSRNSRSAYSSSRPRVKSLLMSNLRANRASVGSANMVDTMVSHSSMNPNNKSMGVIQQTKPLISVKEFVQTIRSKNQAFGIDGYSMPIRDNFYRTCDVMKWKTVKNHNFLD